jgi:NhaP-type Na+/H+ or K+/H+ antiporter
MLVNPRDAIAFYLLLGALNFAGALLLGVGVLATAPISALAIVKAYEQVSAS